MLFVHIFPAHADTIQGQVVSVIDGDTISIIDAQQQQIKVRLAAIDAPEKGQPYGTASKKALSKLIYKQNVLIEWDHDKYSYDRIVGKVLLNGRDINQQQITDGMAWYYRQYANEQSAIDRPLYNQAEEDAKAGKLGLWQAKQPQAPWIWREQKRESTKRTQDKFHDQWLNRNWQFR